jgi:hypothetical protein
MKVRASYRKSRFNSSPVYQDALANMGGVLSRMGLRHCGCVCARQHAVYKNGKSFRHFHIAVACHHQVHAETHTILGEQYLYQWSNIDLSNRD